MGDGDLEESGRGWKLKRTILKNLDGSHGGGTWDRFKQPVAGSRPMAVISIGSDIHIQLNLQLKKRVGFFSRGLFLLFIFIS